MAGAPTLALLEQLATASEVGPATERKRALLIVNPYAATVSDRLRTLVAYALRGRYEVTAVDTERRGHATELCREAAHEGFEVVVAFGGDGTVNEAANGLAGSDVPLTCLPGGSANVFARMVGIPGDIVDATEHLLRVADVWQPRRVDLGTVNGRLFTFSAGVGFDADVVRRVDARPALKARFGPWWFTAAAIGTFLSRYAVDAPRLEAVVPGGGRPLPGVFALVQNGDPYTFFNDLPIRVAEAAGLESGTLSGGVLDRANPVDLPTLAWRLLSKRARVVRHRHVAGFRGVRQVAIRSADGRPVALQVDGDHVGEVAEARFGVLPRRLAVVA